MNRVSLLHRRIRWLTGLFIAGLVWWRLIDCSFGVGGAIPLWFCRRWAGELDADPGDASASV